jgi:hypothetical protein
MRRAIAAIGIAMGCFLLAPAPAKADPIAKFLFGGHAGIGKYTAKPPRKAVKHKKAKKRKKTVKRSRHVGRQRNARRSATIAGYRRAVTNSGGARFDHGIRAVARAPIGGLPGQVKSALRRVQDRCRGFAVVSTFRRGARVAGTRRRSLHADFKAADFKVDNYACAYKALAGWRHGISTDAWNVNHIHISYSPSRREGRFVHRGRRAQYASSRRR